jgi:transcriptional regulator with XRE-family HTH domain
MNLGTLIKKRRLELGISQAKLSKMLNFSTGQLISNIERGACGFPKKRLKKLCRCLLLDQSLVLNVCLEETRKEYCALLGIK